MLVLVPFVCAPRFFSVRGTLEPELRARNKVATGSGWIEFFSGRAAAKSANGVQRDRVILSVLRALATGKESPVQRLR